MKMTDRCWRTHTQRHFSSRTVLCFGSRLHALITRLMGRSCTHSFLWRSSCYFLLKLLKMSVFELLQFVRHHSIEPSGRARGRILTALPCSSRLLHAADLEPLVTMGDGGPRHSRRLLIKSAAGSDQSRTYCYPADLFSRSLRFNLSRPSASLQAEQTHSDTLQHITEGNHTSQNHSLKWN